MVHDLRRQTASTSDRGARTSRGGARQKADRGARKQPRQKRQTMAAAAATVDMSTVSLAVGAIEE